MFAKFGFFLLLFTGLSQLLFSQNIDYQIYITTPGYTSVRSYSKADFEKVKHDFRVMNGPVTITDSLCNSGKTEVRMVIDYGSSAFLSHRRHRLSGWCMTGTGGFSPGPDAIS